MRASASKVVEQELLEKLIPLGIAKARINIQLQEKPLSSDGKDKISFLFSANTTTPMQPISQVASGGEIARVMLSLKAMISGAVKLPTIIFRSEEHTSELQSRQYLVCRLLLEK